MAVRDDQGAGQKNVSLFRGRNDVRGDLRYLHQEEPVHGEKPLTGIQRLHKKGPRQRQLRKVR